MRSLPGLPPGSMLRVFAIADGPRGPRPRAEGTRARSRQRRAPESTAAEVRAIGPCCRSATGYAPSGLAIEAHFSRGWLSCCALPKREFHPLGDERRCSVRVRVVAATDEDLGEAIRTGRFREALFPPA